MKIEVNQDSIFNSKILTKILKKLKNFISCTEVKITEFDNSYLTTVIDRLPDSVNNLKI
jgi:hypothetical protein